MARFRLVSLLFVAVGAAAFGQTAQTTPHLEVPAIAQEPDCPKEGWCGEAAIQMAGMYYGCYFPQKLINADGHPEHPDLWSNNLGPAMDALGLKYQGVPTPSCDGFITALKPILQAGAPVLLGINVYSGDHGDAHFCIAADCDDQKLFINTTWSMGHEQFTWQQLHKKQGITLADVFMGLRIDPPAVLAKHRLRLYAVDSKSFFSKQCKLRLEADGLKPSATYMIQKFASVKDATDGVRGPAVTTFTADKDTFSREVEVDGDQPAVFVLSRLG